MMRAAPTVPLFSGVCLLAGFVLATPEAAFSADPSSPPPHLLLEGFRALHDEDHDPHWLGLEDHALRFLHARVRDAQGHYGARWDREPGAPRMTFELLDQASAARAYWVGAACLP